MSDTATDPQSPETRLERFKMALCEGGRHDLAGGAYYTAEYDALVTRADPDRSITWRAGRIAGQPGPCLACRLATGFGAIEAARDACLAYPTTDPTMLDCGADRA